MSETRKRMSAGYVKLLTATREEAQAESEALREALEEADRLAEPLFWRNLLSDDEGEDEVIARFEIIGPPSDDDTTPD